MTQAPSRALPPQPSAAQPPLPAGPASAPAGPAAVPGRQLSGGMSRQVAAGVLMLACAAFLLWVLNLFAVSQVQEYFAQHALYGQLRLTLAEGATPVGPLTRQGQLVPDGTPMAIMSAPVVGISDTVIVQGSGGAQTMVGIGHVPDTVLPCQAGTAVLMARSGAYGGYALGAKWARLAKGDEFTVTMGQGSCTYRVIDQRLAGQLAPASPTGTEGSIVLTTAAGRPFMPTGVLRIDATLVTKSYAPPAATVPASAVPASQNAMGIDTSHLTETIFLVQVLLAAAAGAAWAWQRWGRSQAWLVAAPVIVTFGLLIADNLNLLLPNLL